MFGDNILKDWYRHESLPSDYISCTNNGTSVSIRENKQIVTAIQVLITLLQQYRY